VTTRASKSDESLRTLRQVQADLDRLRRYVDQSDRLATLGTLLGIVAHEFNNILTPVMSYCQLALADPDDAEMVRKALTKTVQGVEQAGRIASAVMGLARDEESVKAVAAEVDGSVDAALACMGRELAADRIEVVRQHLVGVAVAVEPVVLQHVLLNLILNARKSMLGRGGVLTIRGCSTWNTFTLEVMDTGIGMTRETLDRVFSSANQTLPTLAADGNGFGVLTCLRFVRAAGGRIDADSSPGCGTTVRVTLPLAKPIIANV